MKKTNVIFGIVTGVLTIGLVTLFFVGQGLVKELKAADKMTADNAKGIMMNSVSRDGDLATDIQMNADMTDANFTAVNEAIANANLLISDNATSIEDLMMANADLLTYVNMKDVAIVTELNATINAVNKSLNAKINMVERDAAFALAQAKAKFAKDLAAANAEIADINATVDYLADGKLDRAEAKLERKTSFYQMRKENQMQTINREQKMLDAKIARAEKTIERTEADLAEGYTGGWIWNHNRVKAEARKIARLTADLNRAKADLNDIVSGDNHYTKLINKHLAKIAKLDAKLVDLNTKVETLN